MSLLSSALIQNCISGTYLKFATEAHSVLRLAIHRSEFLMVCCRSTSLLFLLLIAGQFGYNTAYADLVTVLEPTNFTRGSGAPVVEKHSFFVEQLNGDFVLIIHNGGLQDDDSNGDYVSSSIISLNGLAVADPQNFNQNTSAISIPVSLASVNELEVELRGKQGGLITIEITGNVNTAPFADAGVNQSVEVGTEVIMDGSASFDDDGDILAYQWTFVAKPLASQTILVDTTSISPSFTADVTGDYIVGLIVNDGELDSEQSQVMISAIVTNVAPVLDPIGNHTVALGTIFNLNLTATDAEGDSLKYSAQPVPLPDGAILESDTGTFSFKPSAQQSGDYSITFIVSDGTTTDAETITLTVPEVDITLPTRFSGRLLDANAFAQGELVPIVGGTVSFLNSVETAVSDTNGYFMLSNLADGSQILDINNTTAAQAPDGSGYAGFREEIELIANAENIIERPIYLPRIDVASLTTIDPNVMTIVENLNLGISLTVSPHSAKNEDGSDFTGQISISEVPRNLAPAVLPDFLDPGLLVTIQPVGVTFSVPAEITFANTDNLPPGSQADVWSLDPENGVFVIVGIAEVSSDGTVIETVLGGIRAADWHMPLPPQPSPNPTDNNNDNDDPCNEQGQPTGSVATVCSGSLSEEHQLVPYYSQGKARQLRLVYNSNSAAPSPIISNEITIPVRSAVPNTISSRLIVAGIDQGQELYTGTVGLSESQDETIRQAVQFDASEFSTGSYIYRLLSTSNYSSSSVSSIVTDTVLVNNEVSSPFGAGWTLSGLHKIHLQDDGQLLLTTGSGAIMRFLPQNLTLPTTYQAPPRDYSTLVQNLDGTFTRTTKTGTRYEFDAQGLLTETTDRNGNATFYSYSQGLLTSITDPVGSLTTLAYTNGLLDSITDPAMRVTVLTHDGNGDLIQITDPDESVRVFGYDTAHRLTSQISKRGYVTSYEYDFAGRFSRSNRPDGSSRELIAGETFGLIDPAGTEGVTPANPSPFIRPSAVAPTFTGGNGEITRYETDRFGAPTKKTDPNSIVTTTDRLGGVDGRIVGPVEYSAAKIGLGFDFAQPVNAVSFGDSIGNFGTSDFSISFWIKTQSSQGSAVINKRPVCNHSNFWGIRIGGGILAIELDQDGSATNYNAFFSQTPVNDGQYHHITLVRKGNQATNYVDGVFDVSSSTNGVTNLSNSALLQIGTDPCVGLDGTAEFDGQLDEIEVYRKALTAVEVQTLFENGMNGLVDPSFGPEHRWSGNGHANDSVGAQGLPTRVIRPDLSTVFNAYDNKGNRISKIEGYNGATTESSYDPQFSLEISATDALGNITTYSRDPGNGDLISITNALGHQIQMEYDSAGQIIERTDANGLVTSYGYNPDGLVGTVTETPPPGGGLTRTTVMTYDAAGQIKSVITPDNIVQNLNYDLLGRMTSITDNLNQRVEFVNDAEGNQILSKNLEGDGILASTIAQRFDALNRRSTTTQPHASGLDSITKFEYDDAGNMDSFIDPNGQESNNQYDPGNRLISQIDALVGTTLYAYDNNGNVTQVVAANGAQTNYQVDSLGRIVSEVSADRGTLSYTYDLNNNLKTLTDARGITRSYDYDALNRLITISFPNAQEDVTISYDNCSFGIGRVCSYSDESGTTSMQYDAYGNVTDVFYDRDSINYSQHYQYDFGHQISSMTLPSGRQVQYQRDGLQRVSQISSTVNGQPHVVLDQVTYNANHQITQQTYGNGLAETRLYDLQSRLIDTQLTGTDETNLTYDANSNVLSRNTSSDDHSYGYDALDRLETEVNNGSETSYQYDPNGNRLNQTDGAQNTSYMYSLESNILDTIDSQALSYDPSGNLITDQQGRNLFYNDAGRLIEIQSNGQALAQYRYSSNGQRTHKITSLNTFIFHYDLNGNLISETTSNGTPTKDYLWLEGQPVAQIDIDDNQAATINYIHTDHLSAPRLATDPSQAITWRWESEAFGNSEAQSFGIIINLRFPGQYYDQESQLHYNYFRDYDPKTGRYIESDPIGLSGDLNTFAYALQNPIISTDRYGLCGTGLCVGIAVGAVRGARLGYGAYRAYRASRAAAIARAAAQAANSVSIGPWPGSTTNPDASAAGEDAADEITNEGGGYCPQDPDDPEQCKEIIRKCRDKCLGKGSAGSGGVFSDWLNQCVVSCTSALGCGSSPWPSFP